MSAPDGYLISSGAAMPPRFPNYPHCLALLPAGLSVDQVGDPGQQVAGIFLIDAGCAAGAMNDSSLDRYVTAKTPVFLFATRAKDLRPFLRRSDAFKRRGALLEVVA